MPEKEQNAVTYTNGKKTWIISNGLVVIIVTLLVAFLPNIHDKSDASTADVEKITERISECEKATSLHGQQFEFIQQQLIEIKKELSGVKSELRMIWRKDFTGDI